MHTNIDMKKSLYIIVIFITSLKLHAQSQSMHEQTINNNCWFMYFGDHKFSNQLGVHLEVQVRKNDVIQNPQQLLLRTGLNYHINDQIMASIGYCFVETYPYGKFPVPVQFPENRFWEQLQIKNQYGIFEWISRFRLEQRFSKVPIINLSSAAYEPGDAVYTNRFRSLNRVSIPLKGKMINDKTFYISAYDEFFISYGKNVAANLFDQNRAYFALGYKIPKIGRLEIGYMYQAILKGDGIKIENNNTLQLGFISTFNFHKTT